MFFAPSLLGLKCGVFCNILHKALLFHFFLQRDFFFGFL